jgi:hypothetical protein
MGLSATISKHWKFALGSLCCLFPGVGILFGVFFLCFAIFQYRSKVLVVMVLAEVAISACLMIYIFHSDKEQMLHGHGYDELTEKMARHNLKEVGVKLDAYKRQVGEYPDSLMQLLKKFSHAEIDDPILQFKHPELSNHLFYYTKTDSGYILFSAGLDGIPHTKDDIYPARSSSITTEKQTYN